MGIHPSGASIYGAEDLIGNAHEMTLSDPTEGGDGSYPLGPSSDTRFRVIKGIRAERHVGDTYAYVRHGIFPRSPDAQVGFRCRRTPPLGPE